MTAAAASEMNFVDVEDRSMLVLKLSGANILHAPEYIDTMRAETLVIYASPGHFSRFCLG